MTQGGSFENDDDSSPPFLQTLFGRKAATIFEGLGLAYPSSSEEIKAVIARAAAVLSLILRSDQSDVLIQLARHAGELSSMPCAFFYKPTGSGKTPIILHLVSTVFTLAFTEGHPALRTIILVPKTVLGEQFSEEALAWDARLPLVIAKATGTKGEIFQGAVTVMTYQRFTKMVMCGELTPDDVDLIVQDEGHNGLSDLRREVIAPFKGRVYIVSCTATGAFNPEKSVHSLLGGDNCVSLGTNKQDRDAGILCEVINHVVAVKIVGDLGKDRRLAGLMRRRALVMATIELLRGGIGPKGREHTDEGADHLLRERFIFYAQDIAQAKMFKAAYNEAFGPEGYVCDVIRGDEPREVTARKIADFKEGRLHGLANVHVLTEGFNDRTIGLCAGAPANSTVVLTQRGGRPQRKDPRRPDKVAVVIDLYIVENGKVLGKPRAFHQAIGDDSVAGVPLAFTIKASSCEADAFSRYEIVETPIIDGDAADAAPVGAKAPTDLEIPDHAWNAITRDHEVSDTRQLLRVMSGAPDPKRPEEMSLADALADPDRPSPIGGTLREAFRSFAEDAKGGSAVGRLDQQLFRTYERTAPSGRLEIVVDRERRADLYAACLAVHERTTGSAADDETPVMCDAILRATETLGIPRTVVTAFRNILLRTPSTEKVVLEDGEVIDYRNLLTKGGKRKADAKMRPFVNVLDQDRIIDHLRLRDEARLRSESALAQRVDLHGFAAEIGVPASEQRFLSAWRNCLARLLERGHSSLLVADGIDAVAVRRQADPAIEMLVSRSSADAFDLEFAGGRYGAARRPQEDEVPLHEFERSSSPETLSAHATILFEAVVKASARHRDHVCAGIPVRAFLRAVRHPGGRQVEAWYVDRSLIPALRAEHAGAGRPAT